MTVKELKEKLNKYPDNMEVFVPSKTGDYDYGKIYSVHEAKITMQNDNLIDAVIIDECQRIVKNEYTHIKIKNSLPQQREIFIDGRTQTLELRFPSTRLGNQIYADMVARLHSFLISDNDYRYILVF